jgi:hypothetical protein
MQKTTAPRHDAVSGAGAPIISDFSELSQPLVSAEMRAAGGAVIEGLSGVVSAEGLAERVYIAMARVPISSKTKS